MVDGYGAVTWWGFSPALDLQERSLALSLDKMKLNQGPERGSFTALVIGSGDCRHILKTIAHCHRHPRKDIQIYVVENNLEVLARHLLFLSIALESKERLGLQEKTELFLELFGNSLVRPQTSDYVAQKSNEFIRMVTDFDYLASHLPNVNLSQLKFKERDFLEGIFKFWRNKDPKHFDVCKCWEERLRQYLGIRYDSRQNVFDWDYHMKLGQKASIIHAQEYKSWREQGVAFELRDDSTYEVSNRTLASGLLLKKDGQRVARRGYWGDLINSPYLAFGIESEEKSLFEKKNKMHIKTSASVSEYNVTSLMYELMTGERYVAPKTQESDKKKQTATIEELPEEEEEEEGEQDQQQGDHSRHESEKGSLQPAGHMKLDGVTVHLLPLNCVSDLPKKSKYAKLFDLVYFSNSMVHQLTPEVKQMFADECVIITETAKFMLDLKEEQMKEYLKKIVGMAESTGCKCDKDFSNHISTVTRSARTSELLPAYDRIYRPIVQQQIPENRVRFSDHYRKGLTTDSDRKRPPY